MRYLWQPIAQKLGVMPELVAMVEVDPLTGDQEIIERPPHFPTKKSRDDWEKSRDRAEDWAELVDFMMINGMGEDRSLAITAACIENGKTPKQSKSIFLSAQKATVKETKAVKSKKKAVPKPESFGSWS